SRGMNSFLIKSKRELIRVLENLPKGKSFIFQQFIPNDYDWGILVAEGKVVSAEKSFRPKGEFRNNACWGAKEVFLNIDEVDKKVKLIARKSCDILNLEWARADIIVDKNTNEPYLLEVNRFPGMTVGSTEEEAFKRYLKNKLLIEDLR
ncbi:MAG: RimK family alpha-L-glutamate ligase, partial [Promethearchaeota archaeon]